MYADILYSIWTSFVRAKPLIIHIIIIKCGVLNCCILYSVEVLLHGLAGPSMEINIALSSVSLVHSTAVITQFIGKKAGNKSTRITTVLC